FCRSSRRRHTRSKRDWSSDVCSSDLDDLPNEMRVRNQSDAEDRAEAMSLYAEYAIDFATQAMRYALIASLSAIVLQQKAEHKTTDRKSVVEGKRADDLRGGHVREERG